ncbi:MAG: heme-binding domain-containing protein [Aureispira sp.]|nr:heme-binding domain-containing protein [Aureispira sp.]
MIKKIFLLLVVVLIVMQFFGIDKTNPAIDERKTFAAIVNPPADILKLLKDACYDCHSNETKYPWYTNVAPLSWWIKHHVDEGREHLNFSEWVSYSQEDRAHMLHEAAEEIEEQHMPLGSYVRMHSEAALSKEDCEKLEKWLDEASHH